MPERSRSRHLQIVFGLAAFAILLRLSMFAFFEPFFEGDTELLVRGHTKAILSCLKEGRLLNCPDSGVWPLFQNVISLFLSLVGFSAPSTLRALAYLSLFSFLGSVALIFWALKRKASLTEAATGVMILITGPLLWYSHSTFGEMSSAFLILAFTAASLLRARGWIVALLFVLAGSTKEVALPFLFLMGVVCLMPEIVTEWRTVGKHLGWLVLGAILTFIVTVGFNYFRFGRLSNPSYVTDLFIVPTLKIQLSFFFGIWLSPNGGLLFFWPTFTLLYLAVIAMSVFGLLRGKRDRRSIIEFLPLVAVTILLLLLTLGFSRWYTPLGGFAWGPRYMLPWIPAASLLLIYFYRIQIATVFSWLLIKPLRFSLTCVLLILVSIPQLVILFDSSVMARIFAYPECPRVPVIQEGIDYYYQCLQTQIWPQKLQIADLYPAALTPPILWFVLLYAATLIWICYSVRRQLCGRNRSDIEANT